MTVETLNFGADVSRLLDIVAHALYSNRDVFLRELISNASDACDRLRYEALSNPALTKDDADFKIHVEKDTKTRTVNVTDNGIGMTRQEMVENLGTIARSGTAKMVEQLKESKEKSNLIGQFGVGFYASFMVSTKVEVVSRKAGENQAWHWESDGKTGFTIREATADEAQMLGGERGTRIMLHIADEACEFLLEEKLKSVILIWSDHIPVPIYLGEGTEPINTAAALWMRPKNEITAAQYTEFYKHVGHGFDEPVMTSHWTAEGAISYTALLFVPEMRTSDLFDPTRKHMVQLYVKRVFIARDCEGLVYPWLRFLRGIIDSEDLPLNISREMLQLNPVVAKIRSGVAKRVLKDLAKLSDDDAPAFGAFWGQFGAVLKEGLYDAYEHRDDLLKVVRFYSTHGEKLVSFSDYVSRMKEGQKEIYYLSGENLDNLRNSPQLEGFKARGLEVLFFTDTIDDFWLQTVTGYEDKNFKSITKGDIDLGAFDVTAENADKKEEGKKDEAGMKPLLDTIKTLLAEEVSDVRLSSRLTDSPVCLVAAADSVDMRMERVLRLHHKHDAPAKRVLELNAKHPLIKRLAVMQAQKHDLEEAAWLLLDQARIVQGEPVPDPSRFARALSKIMERGLAA